MLQDLLYCLSGNPYQLDIYFMFYDHASFSIKIYHPKFQSFYQHFDKPAQYRLRRRSLW
jgi:hypothetical protein